MCVPMSMCVYRSVGVGVYLGVGVCTNDVCVCISVWVSVSVCSHDVCVCVSQISMTSNLTQ